MSDSVLSIPSIAIGIASSAVVHESATALQAEVLGVDVTGIEEPDVSTVPTVAIQVAGGAAIGAGGRMIFASWLLGDASQRSVAVTLESSEPDPGILEGASGASLRFDDFYSLFEDALLLYHGIGQSRGWFKVAIEEIGWTLWVEGPWPVAACCADTSTAKAISVLRGNKNIMQALAESRGGDSEHQALQMALQAIDLSTTFNPSPIAQAINAAANLTSCVLHLDDGEVVDASLSAMAVVPFALDKKVFEAIYNERGRITGYGIKVDSVRKYGSIGLIRMLHYGRSRIWLPVDLVAEALELHCFDDLILKESTTLARVYDAFPDQELGEAALLGILESNAWRNEFGYSTAAEALAEVRRQLPLAETLGKEAGDIPGLDMLFNALRVANESSIAGGRFTLDWVHANRTRVKELEALEGLTATQGPDVLLEDGVVELKALLPSHFKTETALKWSTQLESRLSKAALGGEYSRYSDVSLIISGERAEVSAYDQLPAAFRGTLDAELERLRTSYADVGAVVTVGVWP